MKKWWLIALGILTCLSLVGEFTGGHDSHGHFWWNGIPGFFIYFGFFGCLLLIHFAKGLGKTLLTKEEDYYKE